MAVSASFVDKESILGNKLSGNPTRIVIIDTYESIALQLINPSNAVALHNTAGQALKFAVNEWNSSLVFFPHATTTPSS